MSHPRVQPIRPAPSFAVFEPSCAGSVRFSCGALAQEVLFATGIVTTRTAVSGIERKIFGQGHSVSFMSMQSEIQTLPLEHGYQTDYSDDSFPSQVTAWSGGSLSFNSDATHFGFVQNESAQLTCLSGSFTLSAGMYFAAPGECTIQGAGAGIVVSRRLYRGVFHLGGPIE